MPTLLEEGNVVPQKWMSAREKKLLSSISTIEYIMDFISDRIYKGRELPKIKIKKPGDKVIVLKSGTGSGKSTVIPPYLYKRFDEFGRGKIGVTQPRVLTAIDIPESVIEYNPELKMGENIGYRTGPMKKSVGRGILYMTVGSLLSEMINKTHEEFMRGYSFILIDEVHERDLNVDSILFELKQLLMANYEDIDCPMVILMSATFDPNLFMEYYDVNPKNFIEVAGRTFPIEKHFAPYDVQDYISYAVHTAEILHVDNIADLVDDNDFRDILIFVQGKSVMKKIIEQLHKFNSDVLDKNWDYVQNYISGVKKKMGGGDINKKYYIAPIMLNSENYKKGGKEYNLLFDRVENFTVPIYKFDNNKSGKIIKRVRPCRKIIVATNVAETGVTIESLKYCIDIGYVTSAEYNPVVGCQLLLDKPVTRGMADQRMGRVGRKSPGVWYGCYTKNTYENMAVDQWPNIITEDISQTLLRILIGTTESKLTYADDNKGFQMNNLDQKWYKMLYGKMFQMSKLDFLQMPPADLMSHCIKKLWALGFINDMYQPTVFGWYGIMLTKIPMESIRMILAGYQHGANIMTLITIVAGIQVGAMGFGIFKNKYKPRNPLKLSNDESRLYSKIIFADEFIEYVFIFEEYLQEVAKIGKHMVSNTSNSKYSLQYLQEWAAKQKFKHTGFSLLIELRDEIIANMLEIGLNPFYNGLQIKNYNLTKILQKNIHEGIDEIIKIKKCIYEGYRCNLALYNKKLNAYITHQTNVKLSPVSYLLHQENLPQKIIVSKILVKPSMYNAGMYEYSPQDISVMDRFVEIDENFLEN